jgi:hypothetical protein
MTFVVNCETVDMSPRLECMGDIETKGTPMTTTMTMKDDDDKRLTPAQRRMRDEAADIPKRYRRSVDAYRRACGFTPLWGSGLERERKRR